MSVFTLYVGDSATGKSSLLVTTIGVDFKLKTYSYNDRMFRLQIWDTAGQERFRTIHPTYFRGAHGVALVFDITNTTSYHHIRQWIADLSSYSDANTYRILVGNKVDLADSRTVSEIDGHTLAKEFNIKYFETSAATGFNVNEAFEELARGIAERLSEENPVNPKIRIGPKIEKKKGGCC